MYPYAKSVIKLKISIYIEFCVDFREYLTKYYEKLVSRKEIRVTPPLSAIRLNS